MSKAKKKHYELTVGFNTRDTAGCVDIIQNTRTGLSDERLMHMVMAPAVEQQPDGTVKIISWSLIPASQVKGNGHGPKSKQ